MPVELTWQPDRSILVAVYKGTLYPDEQRAMLSQRRELLAERGEPVVLIADTRELESIADSHAILKHTRQAHDAIRHTYVILKPHLFRTLRRAIDETPHQLMSRTFVADQETALRLAAERQNI